MKHSCKENQWCIHSDPVTILAFQTGYEFTIVPAIKNQQDVEIYDPIEVTPPLLVFPWDPVRKEGYHYPLKVCFIQSGLLYFILLCHLYHTFCYCIFCWLVLESAYWLLPGGGGHIVFWEAFGRFMLIRPTWRHFEDHDIILNQMTSFCLSMRQPAIG